MYVKIILESSLGEGGAKSGHILSKIQGIFENSTKIHVKSSKSAQIAVSSVASKVPKVMFWQLERGFPSSFVFLVRNVLTYSAEKSAVRVSVSYQENDELAKRAADKVSPVHHTVPPPTTPSPPITPRPASQLNITLL